MLAQRPVRLVPSKRAAATCRKQSDSFIQFDKQRRLQLHDHAHTATEKTQMQGFTLSVLVRAAGDKRTEVEQEIQVESDLGNQIDDGQDSDLRQAEHSAIA